MSWFLIGGAAIGAGVGSYGHDNWGWSKDAIWQGALVGAGGGALAGGAGGAGAAGAGAGTGAGAGGTAAVGTAGSSLAGPPVALANAGVAGSAAGSGGLLAGLTSPLVPGASFTSPLMLGAAGLTLAGGLSSRGSSFQDKLELSKEGKALQKQSLGVAKKQLTKAQAGDVGDKAFQDISNLKTAEGLRQRRTQGSINTIQATVANAPKTGRGTGTIGGSFVKAQLADVGERMTGLFAPTSALNNFRKEELINASKQIQNLSNIDNQTAAFSYGSSLAKWGAQQTLAAEKGAAIGSVARQIGGSQLTSAYLNQMKIAS